jgi:nitroimidazol reductase NimA-like FMN-containing flavoprotein (pyridoxamine 5'-phosphate oxidase superfamily)
MERRRRSLSYTLEDLTRLIAKRNFCVLATQELRGPHVVGVSYFARGLDLHILTSAKTVKVRNVRRDPRVAVHIPVPWSLVPAPMKSIQFRGSAEILPIDDASANEALEHSSFVMLRVMRRLLRNVDVKVWGESVWIHVRPRKRIETFMIGVPSTTIFRDEAKAMLHFEVP